MTKHDTQLHPLLVYNIMNLFEVMYFPLLFFTEITLTSESTRETVLPDGSVQLPEGQLDFTNSILRLRNGNIRRVNYRQEQIYVFTDGTIVFGRDGTTINPDGSVSRGTRFPNGTIVLPSGTTISPDRQVLFPDGSTSRATVRTERVANAPGGRLVLPDGTSFFQPITLTPGKSNDISFSLRLSVFAPSINLKTVSV